jgi:arsenate reductase (glutaredoxin)
MSSYKLFINPNCSKSRAVLDLIKEFKEVSILIRNYIETPVTNEEAEAIVFYFGKESLRDVEQELDNDSMVALLVSDSLKLQRPLIIGNGRGCIARPPEKIKEFLTHVM